MSKSAALACVLAALSIACSKDSTDLSTSNIAADYEVTLNDDPNSSMQNTTLDAYLKDGTYGHSTQDYVDLTGGDSLVVTTDKNDTVALPRVDSGRYTATLPNTDRASFVFHLKRSGSESLSPVALPAHLAMTDSPDGKTIPGSGMIHFAWSNPSHNGKLTVHTGHHVCNGITLSNDLMDLKLDDSGTLDLPVMMVYGAGAPASGDCIDVAIERAVTDDADKSLAPSSSVRGHRTDRFKITVQ